MDGKIDWKICWKNCLEIWLEMLGGNVGWKICWKNCLENLLEKCVGKMCWKICWKNVLEKYVGNVGWKCWLNIWLEKMLVNGCEIIGEKIVATNPPLRLSTTYIYHIYPYMSLYWKKVHRFLVDIFNSGTRTCTRKIYGVIPAAGTFLKVESEVETWWTWCESLRVSSKHIKTPKHTITQMSWTPVPAFDF